jgi:hypothetical protein
VRASRASAIGVLAVTSGVIGLWSLVGTAWAGSATLTGGGVSWQVVDDRVTSNGAPQGGTCETGAPGSGAAVHDFDFGRFNFDSGAMVWVNGNQVGGALTATTNQASFAPEAISGLTVSLTYHAFPDRPTLRVLVRLSNNLGQAGTIPAVVEYVNNFASDEETTVLGDSSGFPFPSYDTSDRWIVTNDGGEEHGRTANISVFYGPGAPAESPVFGSDSVFECPVGTTGRDGSLTRFELEIPEGATQTLMFFQEVRPSEGAVSAAEQYDITPSFPDTLTEGMAQDEYEALVNWVVRHDDDPECSDGVDNDGNGLVDYPEDPLCESASDPAERPQCEDRADNDGDGRSDYPADPGCRSTLDNSESPNPRCSDNIDNDSDGATDYPADPGCISVRDESEGPNPPCSDGVDNDADGATDGADPGCRSPRDTSESPDPQCGDGVDNDGDERTDYPADPGCRSRTDNSESPNPQCSNGVDDDADGRTDYSDDRGCRSARDNSEGSDSPSV